MNREKMAQKLKELRGDKPREEVAVELGISYSSVVAYELGERVPRDEVKVKIASYYGVPVEDIFFIGQNDTQSNQNN
ncbi:MAG TPA: helix-turn-helix transcriptional regulator [Tissierellales bacterium]|nr:helix-turn-helix transcriptional regulator [Tissierellales bacterium]